MHKSSAKSDRIATRCLPQQRALLAHLHVLSCEAREICCEIRELRATSRSDASFACLRDAHDDLVRTLSLYLHVARQMTAAIKTSTTSNAHQVT